MDRDLKRKQSFLLRLPLSVRERAVLIAQNEGTSLNHFISLAVAEKISRMDHSVLPAASPPRPTFYQVRQN